MADVVKSTMKKVIPLMTDIAALVVEVVKKERENIQAEFSMQDDEQVCNVDLPIWWLLKIKFEKLAPLVAPCRLAVVRTRDHEDHHDDDARPEGESSTQEQLDEFDAWMDDFGTDDDEVQSEEVSPELLKEISREVDEAQLQKAVNDMLRVRCNLGEEHQYRLDQIHNYLKSDIVWENKKEDLSLQIPKKPAPVYLSCERDPKDPPMTLLNQDLFYLKHGNLGPKKYVLLLYKYPTVPLLENDPEELTSRWKWSEHLGHEHKYITEIVVRRADGKFGAFSKSNYKYLYKNDIEDLYLMCINGKVKDYRETRLFGSLIVFNRSCVIWERVHDYQPGLESYQQKVNLTALTITFPGIERKKLLTITSKPVVGLIYENINKEKRVMEIKENPKFCDATLIRVLKLVEKKNMDVKYGYEDPKLSDNDAEYLRLYEEYIKDRLRHQDQMRRWESYVNRRALGSRRDRPE
ncbi:hypothetical protein Tco_1392972 [Tanacetum coccineum]